MPTPYTPVSNTTTAPNEHAFTIPTSDSTVQVLQNVGLHAQGSNAHGIFSSGTDNHLTVAGQVTATGSGGKGIQLGGSSTIRLQEGALASSQTSTGISISGQGSSTIWNAGEIKSDVTYSIQVGSGRVQDVFTLFNVGTVRGEIGFSHTGIIINKGSVYGTITGGNGNDIYDGREGLWFDNSAAGRYLRWIDLGRGDDQLYGGAGSETVFLGEGRDFIDGGGGVDTLIYSTDSSAPVGSLTIDLRQTDWQNTGGLGFKRVLNVENILYRQSGTATLTGNDEANRFESAQEHDVPDGGKGDDYLASAYGSDRLLGGEGNDTLDGGYENDVLNGGDGFDTVVFKDAEELAEAVFVNMANKDDTRNTYGADTYIGIEALVGTSQGDTFIGNADNNTFTGGKGNDTLDGGGGVNTAVFSGNSSEYDISPSITGAFLVEDLVADRDGIDRLTNIRFARFEADNKTVALINSAPASVSLSNASVAENAANAVVGRLSSTDADGDAVSYAIAAGPDGVFAIRDGELVVTRALDFEAKTQHSVTVTAKDAWGGETTQSFTVSVTDLLDTTPGTPGNPGTPGAVNLVLRGTSGANLLTGQAGHDTLYGGLGKDVLTGSTGQDVFVFDTRPNSRTNLDTITDFVAADDSLQLDNKYLKKLGSGSASKPAKLKAAFFKVADKAKDGNDYLVYNKKTGVLYYDEDGSGAKAAIAIAKLANKASLTKNDFFVI